MYLGDPGDGKSKTEELCSVRTLKKSAPFLVTHFEMDGTMSAHVALTTLGSIGSEYGYMMGIGGGSEMSGYLVPDKDIYSLGVPLRLKMTEGKGFPDQIGNAFTTIRPPKFANFAEIGETQPETLRAHAKKGRIGVTKADGLYTRRYSFGVQKARRHVPDGHRLSLKTLETMEQEVLRDRAGR